MTDVYVENHFPTENHCNNKREGCHLCSINEYSKLRNDSLCVEPGQTLHQDCRREYTNMKSFKSKGAQQPKAESRVLG